ncbi:MAG: cache domain-containing protein [Pseudomonadota bacterium]
MGKDEWTTDQVEARLKSTLLNQPNLFGVGVAFEPYAFDRDVRLYAPYLIRQDRMIRRIDIADHYDYTEKQYQWYQAALQTAPHWNSLYLGQVSQTWLIEYLVPVMHEGDPVGLVFINYALDSLQKRIDLTDLGEHGYSFIVDDTGRLVDYPIVEKVYGKANISDMPGFQGAHMKGPMQQILSRIPGQTGYLSDITQEMSWLYYAPVPGTKLSVLTVFEQRSLLPKDLPRKRELIQLLMTWCLLLLLLITASLIGQRNLSVYHYWHTAFLATGVISAAIAALWYISLHEESDANQLVTPIASHADLDDFMRAYTRESLLNRGEPPLYLPTGVFIQSVEFSSANNVVLTGYIWQRYHNSYHKDLSQGIVMPEAETLEIEEAYRRRENGSELIGWYFRVTLRQNFDYSRYPLDRQLVWIRLWHKDFDRNVILVPDLGAYDQLNPHWLPGIEKDFVISGLTLWRSFFNYHHHSYNTNFGIENYVGQNKFPELYFNIGLKRDFFDPFVSQLAPMVVVLLMLFAVLVTSSRDETRNALLGFNTAGVLASCSALFFVILLSHIDLRRTISAKEIIYLEDFYFITYLSLLLVSINSILFSWGIRFPVINNISLIQHRDNLVPKLLFWPMVSGQLLVLTLLSLYPYNG